MCWAPVLTVGTGGLFGGGEGAEVELLALLAALEAPPARLLPLA